MNTIARRVLLSCIVACIPPAVGWQADARPLPRPAHSRQQSATDARIAALEQSLRETRSELGEMRAEVAQLRSMLDRMNAGATLAASPAALGPAAPQPPPPPAPETAPVAPPPAANGAQRPAAIRADDWQVLNAKIDQQAQEKVESGSKYRLRLWGLALFNASSVAGHVDNLDVPTVAYSGSPGDPSGSLSASLRQSIIGVTGVGPDLLGARTSADLQMDFFGGLPGGYGAATSGIFRLRLSRLRLDWAHTSLIAGLDTPFFSPNVPTSYMSLAVPAFAAAGNLWTWSPMIRVEQRFDTSAGQFKIEAGLLDPAGYAGSNSAVRRPSPGENSRQPVYAVRFSANGSNGDRPVSVGVSGLYLPQRFLAGTTASGWGSILDWRFPVLPRSELSGELFLGKGLDALGAVPEPVVTPQEYNVYIQGGAPALARLTMWGGWSQWKVTVNAHNEFNAAIGTGGRNAAGFAQAAVVFPPLEYLSPRNQMMFVNYILRPRSDLLFSAEYRRLRTYPLSGTPAVATQVGLALGFLF